MTMVGRDTAGVEEEVTIAMMMMVVMGARTEVTVMPLVMLPLVGQARG